MNLKNISGESHIISSGIHHLNEYIVRDNISVASCQSLCFVLNAACVHDIQIYKDTRCSALKRLRQKRILKRHSICAPCGARYAFVSKYTYLHGNRGLLR